MLLPAPHLCCNLSCPCFLPFATLPPLPFGPSLRPVATRPLTSPPSPYMPPSAPSLAALHHAHRGCSWNSWTMCSMGSAAAGRRPTWSCCCSVAARSRTGWPPRCCSARPRASARSCSRSSSRSRPCECGRRAVGGGRARRAPSPLRHSLTPPPTPRSCKQNQDLLSFYAVVMGLDNAAVSRLRLTWEVMTRLPFPLLPLVLAGLGRGAAAGVLGLRGSPRRQLLEGREPLCRAEGGALFWQVQPPGRALSLANGPCPVQNSKKPESPPAWGRQPRPDGRLGPWIAASTQRVPSRMAYT